MPHNGRGGDDNRWRIVSRYSDGDAIIEEYVTGTRDYAEARAERVREHRADQDEGPAVEVERINAR